MSKATPCAGKNAISAVAFAVVFENAITPSEAHALRALKQRWKTPLPNFQEVKTFALNVSSNADTIVAPSTPTQFAGVLLQSFKPDGTRSWALQVSNNSIVANCSEYSRWHTEWPRARRYLLSAAGFLQRHNPVNALVLQVVDRFSYAGVPQDYSLGDVFNPASDLLTERVNAVGHRWHIHQGWFEPMVGLDLDGSESLHTLKIGSAILDEDLVATIDHAQQVVLRPPRSISDLFGSGGREEEGSSFLNATFEALHASNKTVVQDLLAEDQRKAVGL